MLEVPESAHEFNAARTTQGRLWTDHYFMIVLVCRGADACARYAQIKRVLNVSSINCGTKNRKKYEDFIFF